MPLQRIITVCGRTCHGLLLSAGIPVMAYYCLQTYHTCSGLLLSAYIPAADYYSHVHKGGIVWSYRHSTCFLQDFSHYSPLTIKTCIGTVCTFLKITFYWVTSFIFWFQISDLESAKNSSFFDTHIDLLKKKSFLLWTVLLLAANNQDFAYYCPWTQFAEGLLHLPAKVIGLGKDRWRGFYVNCEVSL